jgi:polyisoprenoid-binding protein YceI
MTKGLMINVISLIFASTAISQVSTWTADPAHTHIGFKVRHMMVAYVNGEFKEFDIKVSYDQGDITKSKVEVTIDATSISTDNERRDNDLRSDHFFDVTEYPSITFVSKGIAKIADGLEMTGDLTMHGVTKEVTFTVDGPTAQVKDPRGNIRMGASATGKINRMDYGLTWNVPLEGGGVLAGNDVSLLIDVELIKDQMPE